MGLRDGGQCHICIQRRRRSPNLRGMRQTVRESQGSSSKPNRTNCRQLRATCSCFGSAVFVFIRSEQHFLIPVLVSTVFSVTKLCNREKKIRMKHPSPIFFFPRSFLEAQQGKYKKGRKWQTDSTEKNSERCLKVFVFPTQKKSKTDK